MRPQNLSGKDASPVKRDTREIEAQYIEGHSKWRAGKSSLFFVWILLSVANVKLFQKSNYLVQELKFPGSCSALFHTVAAVVHVNPK